MSYTEDKVITKKKTKCGVVDERRNHILYEHIDGTEKYRIKGQKKPEPKPKELIDNYRYIETKIIKKEDKRRRSIVKHKRLSSPVGKETPYTPHKYNSMTSSHKKKSRNSLDGSTRTNKHIHNKSYESYTHGSYKKTRNKNVPSYGKYSTPIKSSNERRRKIKKKFINVMNENVNKNEEYTPNLEQNMNSGYNNPDNYPLNENVNNYNQNNQSQNYYAQNTYDERYLEKGQQYDNYDGRYLEKGQQYLPFYPDDFKYKSKTENLKICKKCGKPKKPKEADSSNTTGYVKQSISRETYENQGPQDVYANNYSYSYNYNYDNNRNHPEAAYKGLGVDYQQQYEGDYSSYKSNYCPIHGYH